MSATDSRKLQGLVPQAVYPVEMDREMEEAERYSTL